MCLDPKYVKCHRKSRDKEYACLSWSAWSARASLLFWYLNSHSHNFIWIGRCASSKCKSMCCRKLGALWALPWFDRTRGSADPKVGLQTLGFSVLLSTSLCNVFGGGPPPHLFLYLFLFNKTKDTSGDKTLPVWIPDS
jgi:hypothetical protein